MRRTAFYLSYLPHLHASRNAYRESLGITCGWERIRLYVWSPPSPHAVNPLSSKREKVSVKYNPLSGKTEKGSVKYLQETGREGCIQYARRYAGETSSARRYAGETSSATSPDQGASQGSDQR